MHVHPRSRAIAAAAVLLAAVACGRPNDPVDPGRESTDAGAHASPVVAPSDASLGAAVNRQLADLRRATARFHRSEAAAAAGYTVLVTHPTTGAACLADPVEGGMGRHYLNPALVDDQVVASRPEVVIYEPKANGELRLVGVEYVIPYAIRGPDEDPPTLFGREFLHNPTFGLWMLHVYTWKHNPDGIFATWNPAISCEHDGMVD